MTRRDILTELDDLQKSAERRSFTPPQISDSFINGMEGFLLKYLGADPSFREAVHSMIHALDVAEDPRCPLIFELKPQYHKKMKELGISAWGHTFTSPEIPEALFSLVKGFFLGYLNEDKAFRDITHSIIHTMGRAGGADILRSLPPKGGE